MKNSFVFFTTAIVFMFCLAFVGYQAKAMENRKGSEVSFESEAPLSGFVCDEDTFLNVTNEEELATAMFSCVKKNIENVSYADESEQLNNQALRLADDYLTPVPKGTSCIMTAVSTVSVDKDNLEKTAVSLWWSLESGCIQMMKKKESYGTGVHVTKENGEYNITVVILAD